MQPIVAEPLTVLRARTSAKWTMHPDDVLPLFVAEMDFPLADPVREAILARVQASDTGYANGCEPAATAFSDFARRRWSWEVDPAGVLATTDVSVAVVETLRAALAPGDPVVIMPPVYPPFVDYVAEAGGRVVEVPLRRADAGGPGWAIDLAGIAAALEQGARGILLCSPHNPLGVVHGRDELTAVAALADEYGAVVVSDEIHAPLVHAGETFTPFLAVPGGAEVGIAAHSASKAWNLAGVKSAFIVSGGERGRELLASMPMEVGWRASILGLAGAAAAYADGEPWLDGAIATIESNVELLRGLLAEHLPGAVLHAPRASYLAWVDLRGEGFGDDPAEAILRDARVALSRGLDFGREGAGFARINVACGADVLEEAVRRIAAARPV